jgi:riboflavin kinase/FMN adenylyltransferase
MRDLVIGYDHGLGRGRSGDGDTLRRLGEADGFGVTVVPPVEVDGVRVSSSRIREAVAAGDLGLAARLLGRPYRVTGPVVRGEQRGRGLGVPTVNLDVPPRKLLPPDGVYAARVEWRGGVAGGMLNQGPKPTFGDGRRTLEAHLFGVERDLYGEWVRIEWVARLRETRRHGGARPLNHHRVRRRTPSETDRCS